MDDQVALTCRAIKQMLDLSQNGHELLSSVSCARTCVHVCLMRNVQIVRIRDISEYMSTKTEVNAHRPPFPEFVVCGLWILLFMHRGVNAVDERDEDANKHLIYMYMHIHIYVYNIYKY